MRTQLPVEENTNNPEKTGGQKAQWVRGTDAQQICVVKDNRHSGRCETCYCHVTAGKAMGLCHSVSDAETEVSTNCELKGSGQ